jgi:hypothetical protein
MGPLSARQTGDINARAVPLCDRHEKARRTSSLGGTWRRHSSRLRFARVTVMAPSVTGRTQRSLRRRNSIHLGEPVVISVHSSAARPSTSCSSSMSFGLQYLYMGRNPARTSGFSYQGYERDTPAAPSFRSADSDRSLSPRGCNDRRAMANRSPQSGITVSVVTRLCRARFGAWHLACIRALPGATSGHEPSVRTQPGRHNHEVIPRFLSLHGLIPRASAAAVSDDGTPLRRGPGRCVR